MGTAAARLKINDEIAALIKGGIDTGNVMVLAVVDETQQPLLSFRGSTSVFSDDQLSIWVRNAQGATLTAIQKNPERKGAAIIIDLDQISGVLGFGADGPIWVQMKR